MLRDYIEAMCRLDAQTKEHPADLSGLYLPNVSFVGRDVTHVNFQNAHLVGADFTGADLTKANFTNANVQEASFRNAYLSETIWCDTHAPHADFTNANVHDLCFVDCNLQHAIFTDCVWVNVRFSNTRIQGRTVANHYIGYEWNRSKPLY